MPYVKQSIRDELLHRQPRTSAELSYCICKQIKRFMEENPNGGFEGMISKVYGAIEASKHAFQTDVAYPREMNKRAENGRVF